MSPLILFALAALVAATTYENSQVIDPNAQYLFYWTADTTNQILYVKLSINSLGWVGFGRSANGGMIGSDVFIAWMGTSGPVLHDRLAVQKAEPPLDTDNGGTEDWTLVSLTQNSGYTYVEAQRAFHTGDSLDHDFTDGPQQLVFSWNPVAPADGQPVPYHSGGRYPVTLSLWGAGGGGGENGIDNSTFPPDTKTGEMLMPGFQVPTTQTNYYCTGFDMANATVQGSGQVIAFEPVVENPLVVHHLVIWICSQAMPVGPYDCAAMSPLCTDIMYAWAVGGPGFTVPEVAGFPFGPGGARYASLQVHYDNGKALSGIVDHSGVRLYYTQTPRQYNAGFIVFGTGTDSILLPPGQSSYEIQGSCPSTVTTQLGGLTLTAFASFLHMHKRGRQIWTDQTRNGQLIGDMGTNKFFDFNFQQIFVFQEPYKTIKAGDSLLTHCIYDTTNETTTVGGGEATDSEMCFNFVAYYPKLPTGAACVSDAVHPDSGSSLRTPMTVLVVALISAMVALQL